MSKAEFDNLNTFYTDIGNFENCSIVSHFPFYAIQCPASSWPNVLLKKEDADLRASDILSIAKSIRDSDYPKLLILEENHLKNNDVEFLTTAGFRPVGKWIDMEMSIDKKPNVPDIEEFRIEVLHEDDSMTLQKWISIVQRVLFSNKPLNTEIFKEGMNKKLFKLLMGSFKGEAASTTLLYCGNNAGIFMVATLPFFQKKGFGKAMMVKTHELAHSFNYNHFFLQSTSEGFKLYESLDYKQLGNLILFYFINN